MRAVAFDGGRATEIGFGFAVSPIRDGFRKQAVKGIFEIGDIDAILRALRTCHAGLNGREIDVDVHAVFDISFFRHPEEVLRFEIIFERAALFRSAACGGEVVDGLGINGKEAHRGAVFGSHVRDRRAVGERECGRAFAIEFHKLTNHFRGAEELGNMEREIGRGDAFAKLIREVHAHNFWGEEIHGLAEHSCLGFDATNTPTDNTQTIDHGRVRVSTDERVGIIDHTVCVWSGKHPLREILEVHLVNDADTGRHNAEGLECLLSPFEKLVPLAVALEFHVQIQLERLGRTIEIHLHRVVHNEIHGHEGFDDRGIAAEAFDCGAHSGEVHQKWHASEILKDNASDNKGNFLLGGGFSIPVGERFDIVGLDFFSVAVAKHGFEDDANADGEFRNRADASFFESRERVEERSGFTAGVEGAQGVEWRCHGLFKYLKHISGGVGNSD